MRTRGQDPTLPEMRRVRLLEMADAMDMFCQGLVCAFTGCLKISDVTLHKIKIYHHEQ
ncbi:MULTISPECIES: hypothetical protein [Pseudomonadota]|uniref:hypothetical protein n=1 Tax=Pseudomonadota TaxID=1224 RepID=UPI000B019DC0|nr:MULTISPECIES: hypothetical protein [Gammaproteobacteria]CAG2269934.1 hypothetical protein BCCR75501_00247 [Burkholderia cenocepacia]CAG2271831.1 hypothetical protein BCCR75587_00390 [Burkholderia cenocepacia]CAG2272195.1 hypothetical protein BCCR75502_00421 [Burkholderia cenocepacia]CAG2272988.1 hypothetical protein BCCR75499_00472 [Burkholderia cenocepacia]CAG2286738.1 hypothetical protein BCCR75389_02529 [Burkholderia cenocepacia]